MMLIVVLLIMPKGAERTAGVVDFGDKSVLHRFHIWQGAVSIVNDYFPFGLPSNVAAGTLYAEYYQPLEISENYLTMISDPFTVAAKYGIAAFVAAYFLALLIPLWGLFCWWKKPDVLLLALIGACCAYLLGSAFTTFLNDNWLVSSFWVIQALTLARLLCVMRGWGLLPCLKSAAAMSAIMVVFAAIAMMIAGLIANSRRQWRAYVDSLKDFPEENGVHIASAAPNGSKAVMVVQDLQRYQRKKAIAMAIGGYDVWVRRCDWDENSVEEISIFWVESKGTAKDILVVFDCNEKDEVAMIVDSLAHKEMPASLVLDDIIWDEDQMDDLLDVDLSGMTLEYWNDKFPKK